jgi:hypothetical protein
MYVALSQTPPPLSFFSWVTGAVIMVVGVVVPIGWFMVKNKQAVQGALGSLSTSKNF